MRQDIAKVIEAFRACEPGKGRLARELRDGTKPRGGIRRCSTDGAVLYSYAMPIAVRLPDMTIVLVPRDAGPTVTTRSHIDACAQTWGAAFGPSGLVREGETTTMVRRKITSDDLDAATSTRETARLIAQDRRLQQKGGHDKIKSL